MTTCTSPCDLFRKVAIASSSNLTEALAVVNELTRQTGCHTLIQNQREALDSRSSSSSNEPSSSAASITVEVVRVVSQLAQVLSRGHTDIPEHERVIALDACLTLVNAISTPAFSRLQHPTQVVHQKESIPRLHHPSNSHPVNHIPSRRLRSPSLESQDQPPLKKHQDHFPTPSLHDSNMSPRHPSLLSRSTSPANYSPAPFMRCEFSPRPHAQAPQPVSKPPQKVFTFVEAALPGAPQQRPRPGPQALSRTPSKFPNLFCKLYLIREIFHRESTQYVFKRTANTNLSAMCSAWTIQRWEMR
jgi:hypothetical protein